MSEEVQVDILSHLSNPYRAFFLFLMRQGCRPGEARALKWDRVDLKDDVVTIAAGFDLGEYKEFTKERDVRYLPLHPQARGALLELPRSIGGFVFVGSNGLPLSSRNVIRHWRRAAERAGVKVTCYGGTRHSFASQAINRGASERMVGDFMGHKTTMSTRRYAKMQTEALKLVWGEVIELPSQSCPKVAPGSGSGG